MVSQTELAYRVVSWLIRTTQLAPDSAFAEAQLAKRLGMGRMPVREALWSLRKQGLVSVEGRSGYRVAPVTIRDVHDLAIARRAVEGELVALVARAGGSFNEASASSGQATQEPSAPAEWIESDRRTHLAYAAAAGNGPLAAAIEPLLEMSARLAHMVIRLDPQAKITQDHDALVDAIRSREPDRARRTMLEEISSTEDVIARTLRASASVQSARVTISEGASPLALDVVPVDLATFDLEPGGDLAELGAAREPIVALIERLRHPNELAGRKLVTSQAMAKARKYAARKESQPGGAVRPPTTPTDPRSRSVVPSEH